jgi:predicted nucleotidyltransferase
VVAEAIALSVRQYLMNLRQYNIPISYGVIYGSQVRGESGQWSDIDLLVVSPQYDRERRREDINLLRRVAAHTDSRIEPIPVGQQQYLTDDSSAIIEIARREGQIIPIEEHATE